MYSKFSIVLALLGVVGIAACTVREVPYEDEIAAWRTDKDRFMRESSESPVIASERKASAIDEICDSAFQKARRSFTRSGCVTTSRPVVAASRR